MKFKAFILYSLTVIFFTFCLAIAGIYLYLAPKLPSVESLREVKLQTPLRVYSRNLKLIGEFGEKRRIPIAFSDTPPLFIKAILAAEDDRFFSHSGVDIKGLIRAFTQLISSGEIQTGGSTITMQVARNFFLSSSKTFARKFNEILLALQIERELSKQEILELYINKIYLGNRAYGLGAASQVYYGLPANELSLAELAMVAGLPKAPSSYNPLVNPERALIRRDWILDRMLKLDYITPNMHQEAKASPITAQHHGLQLDLDAPYVAEVARKFALDLYGNDIYTEGYQIITTVDEALQTTAQQAVQAGILAYDQRHGYRGPENHIDIDLTVLTDEEGTTDLLRMLKQFPTYGALQAAVVLQMDDNSLRVLDASGEFHKFSWTSIKTSLKPYISEDQVGSTPAKPENVFKLGDIIRLQKQTDDSWSIAQLPEVQAALVALNPENGAVISMVGGFDFNQSKYNRTIQANRQPGSNFKPFIYTTALDSGMTPATLINDAPIVFDDTNLENTWRPVNASGKFFGPTRLRVALYKSRNLVSIRLLKSLGIETAISGVERFGFDAKKLPKDLSLALGSYAISPLSIATGYAAFANGGYKVEPHLVNSILDNQGQVLYRAQPLTVCRNCEQPANDSGETIEALLEDLPDIEMELAGTSEPLEGTLNDLAKEEMLPEAPRIVDERVIFIMDSMLKDVIQKGTGRKALALKRNDIAGKTGTTNGPTDAWFSGYHTSLVTTTWLGFDNNRNLGRKEFGGSAALPIWINYMQTALQGAPESDPVQPDGLVTVRINPTTGKRANATDSDAIFEMFRSENTPQETNTDFSPTNSEQEIFVPGNIF